MKVHRRICSHFPNLQLGDLLLNTVFEYTVHIDLYDVTRVSYFRQLFSAKSACGLSLKNLKKGSGYRTTRGSLNLKLYSTISCNVIVTHEENALDFVKT